MCLWNKMDVSRIFLSPASDGFETSLLQLHSVEREV